VLGALLMFLIFGTGSFVLLAEFLGRSLSALIAVPVALILTVSSIRRRRR
jgi:hypothetical protein